MKQLVHNVSYLTKTTLSLETIADVSFEAIALPAGAEVISVSVEVQEVGSAGTTLSVGLKGDEDFFARDLDLSQKAQYTSANQMQMQNTGTILIKANQKSTSGVLVIRAFYFLPSTISTEF